MFSASCIMKNIHFDIHVEAETDTDVFIVPAELFENLQKASLPLANYTNQLMAARFSDVMWVMEQIIFKSLDSRIATLLLEQSAISDSEILDITHDAIARHLGTAREVVTRALKYLAAEGMVSVSRGKITILHLNKLTKLAEG
jgi:CRP/FNR family transcriptional regulator